MDEVETLAKVCPKGHVNNVVYNRYAETGRVDWFAKLATYTDPSHAKEWRSIFTPQGDGLLLRKITTEFKFVSGSSRFWNPAPCAVIIPADKHAAYEISGPYLNIS